jgi:hypothetical protein
LETVGLTTAPSSVVKLPRIAEVPASLECTEWGTLQIGENRLIIGLVKRVHVREELIDRETLRIRDERFHVIGRMASLHWYCRTRDRFEMSGRGRFSKRLRLGPPNLHSEAILLPLFGGARIGRPRSRAGSAG